MFIIGYEAGNRVVYPGVRVVVFNVTFYNILVISWWSANSAWRKPVYQEKTTDFSQVTDKLYS